MFEDIRWEYEPVSYLCPDIDPDSDSSDDGSRDKRSKYQENLGVLKQEEVVFVPHSNPRRLREGYQRELQLIKSYIKNQRISSFLSRT